MIEAREPTSNRPFYKRVIKFDKLEFKDYLLILTFLTYVSGFLITNFFLGSFGVVHFDLLRVKYIISGILYLSFILAILLPVYGFVYTLRVNIDKSKPFIIFRACWYTLLVYTGIFLIIELISLLAGSSYIYIGFPYQSKTIPLSLYLESSFLPIAGLALRFVLFSLALLPFMIMFIFLAVVISNPEEDGKKLTRKETARRFFISLKDDFGTIIKGILIFFLVIFIFLLIFLLVVSILLYYVSSDLPTLYQPSSSGILLGEGWNRFFIISISFYIVISLFLSLPFLLTNKKREQTEDEYKLSYPENLLYNVLFITIFLTITLSVYTTAIYPLLPQQLGGGKPIPVKVDANIENFESVSSAINDIYLIDRTSRSTIFLVDDYKQQKFEIVEVSNPHITSITYLSNPLAFPPE